MAASTELSCLPETSEIKLNKQDLNFEVLVGTYEEFILGYRLGRNSEGGLTFVPSFTNHSHTGSIRCVANCRKFLASGSTDESIRLFNMKTRSEHGFLQHHTGSVTCLEFFKNSHLFSSSEDGNVCVWNTRTWTCEKTLIAHKGGVTAISIHPSGKLALSIGKDKSMKTWNLIKGRVAYVTNLKAVGDCIRWSPNGNFYAVAFNTNISVYSVEVAGVVFSVNVQKRINDMVYLSDSLLAVALDGPNVEIYNVEKKEKILEFAAHEKRVKGITSVSFEGESYIITASNDGHLKLWQLKLDDSHREAELITQINTTCRVTSLTLLTGATAEVKENAETKTAPDAKNSKAAAAKNGPTERNKRKRGALQTSSGKFQVEPLQPSTPEERPSTNGSSKRKKKN